MRRLEPFPLTILTTVVTVAGASDRLWPRGETTAVTTNVQDGLVAITELAVSEGPEEVAEPVSATGRLGAAGPAFTAETVCAAGRLAGIQAVTRGPASSLEDVLSVRRIRRFPGP